MASLSPSNITVHTLALKKGADLFEKRENLPSAEEVTEMVAYHTIQQMEDLFLLLQNRIQLFDVLFRKFGVV